MPHEIISFKGERYQVILPNKIHEPAFRSRLSNIIQGKYGEVISRHNIITALQDSFDFYAEELEKEIRSIVDVSFFVFVYILHEDTAVLSYKSQNDDLFPIDRSYFNQYRRILKLILQESCMIDTKSSIKAPDSKMMNEFVFSIEKLVYLGTFLIDMVEAISEEKITGGSIDIVFNNAGLIIFENTYYWNNFIPSLMSLFIEDGRNSIIDSSIEEEFNRDIKPYFGLDLNGITEILARLQYSLESQNPPRLCTLAEFLNLVQKKAGGSLIVTLVKGLILNRNNVASIKDAVHRPYLGKRIIHKPILTLCVDGTDCIITHQYSFFEALNTFFQNNITMGKIPEEWETITFLKDMKNKYKMKNKDILENPVEKLLQTNNILYDRNIKTLNAKNNHNLSINQKPGEIDFLFILRKRIYIADCKNLTKRYEIHGYYQDIAKFTTNGYNKKMKEKVEFVKNNLGLIQEHLQIKRNIPDLDLTGYDVEGIFIINTPTLYMLNGEFKIYTFHRFNLLLTGDDFFNKYIEWPQINPTHKIRWPFIDNLKAILSK
jgi:hypothetical protein